MPASTREEQAKRMRFLQSRGFASEIIFKLLSARKEVTNREWFEFVNDPETLAKIDAGRRRIILPREPSKLLVREREGSGFEMT